MNKSPAFDSKLRKNFRMKAVDFLKLVLKHILLREEIPANHLGCIKPEKNEINYQPQLVFSPDFRDPSTVFQRVTKGD